MGREMDCHGMRSYPLQSPSKSRRVVTTPIIDNPKDPLGTFVGFLSHHVVDQLQERVDAIGIGGLTEDFPRENVQSGSIAKAPVTVRVIIIAAHAPR